MPRADPRRSDYCASRHLLRHLEDAFELQRNPLVWNYFAGVGGVRRRRDPVADRAVLERIRADVRASLARCSEHAVHRTHLALGRIHAVLLRGDIDDQAPRVVAAELGLSERQLRRERRAAHDAFVRAFRSVNRATPPPATVCDVVSVRLAEAVELHELGQDVLAQATFASIAANAPAVENRIEALCVAAEAEFDALRHASAATHLTIVRTLIVRHARDLGDDAARMADQQVDFIAWLLRWQTAVSGGLSMQPPIVFAAGHDDRAGGEHRGALFARAAAAYAMQRWEVGDYEGGCVAVRRALDVVPTLHPTRTKERLAVMMADSQLYGLRARPGADRHRFRAIEEQAALHGHVRTMLAARSERIVAETAAGPGAGRIRDSILRPFGPVERRTMARTFAWSAHIVTQCESDPRDSVASAELAEGLVPPRSLIGLVTRSVRANAAIEARRYDEARQLAESVYSDATVAGNGRLRGAAARSLAAIALACRRQSAAQRYIREALSLTERYGSFEAIARTHAVARRLGVS